MSLLEQTVERVKQWGSDRADDRKQCIALLQQIARNMDSAIAVWEALQQEAPETRNAFTAILAIGPERAKKLYQIYQDQKDVSGELTALSGVKFRDTLGIMDEIDTVQAYGQLKPDETVVDRAAAAIATMKNRRQRVKQAIESLRQ